MKLVDSLNAEAAAAAKSERQKATRVAGRLVYKDRKAVAALCATACVS